MYYMKKLYQHKYLFIYKLLINFDILVFSIIQSVEKKKQFTRKSLYYHIILILTPLFYLIMSSYL